ncbi:MAG: hypothetical protein SVR94_18190 [Pseudomonadota bacterium]|nr:hypothetical protein [Pseudomonadota bacterium]
MKKLFLLAIVIFNLLFSQFVFADMGRVSSSNFSPDQKDLELGNLFYGYSI